MTCSLYTDIREITHAKAANDDMAFSCLGYLHGRDRAFQADFLRRIGEGRVSEILGKDYLKQDFFMRLMGFKERAQQIVQQMSTEQKVRFKAYASGVTRGFQDAGETYEFKKFDYRPEPWTPEDSVVILLLESFDQTKKSFEAQLIQSDRKGRHGESASADFSEIGLPWDTTVMKKGEYPASVSPAANGGVISDPTQENRGSNNWVVGPSRSATAHAFLANDPHLDLLYPPFWYWAHIESDKLPAGLNVIGATIPGTLTFASGSNLRVAWGLTTAYLPVARLAYIREAELKETQTFWPLIWVKLGPVKLPFFFKSFQRLRDGKPILPIRPKEGYELVLNWTGLGMTAKELEGQNEILFADSILSADHAFSNLGLPAFNFVFADDEGRIGYRTAGRVPKSSKSFFYGIPTKPLREFESEGEFGNVLLSPDEMPHLMEPVRGYIVTANNRQWAEDAKFQLGYNQRPGLRAFRIEELLKTSRSHDLKTQQQIQCDVQDLEARFLLPQLLPILAQFQNQFGKRELSVFQALERWAQQGQYKADLQCSVCGVFARWSDRMKENGAFNINFIYRKLTASSPNIETKNWVYHHFIGSLDDLGVKEDGILRTWGELHQSPFKHLAGEKFFSSSAIPTPGAEQSVNLGASDFQGGHFVHIHGPSERMIVELSHPPAVYSVLSGPNIDREKRQTTDWKKWVDCDLERQEFPLDWTKVQSQQIQF